jgi:type III restriction enzyme
MSSGDIKKRQEIGRGLRLPVNQDGERVFDETINKLTVIANESYESFAKNLQTEYEDDCGITFGKLPSIAFSKLVTVVDGKEEPVGREVSQEIWTKLVNNGFLTDDGKILPKFNPKAPGFDLALSPAHSGLKAQIIDVMQSYRIERHIKNESEKRKLEINKRVYLDPEFEKLWEKIKAKTTYSVQYATEELVKRCVKAAQEMPTISPVKVAYQEFLVGVQHKGITTSELRNQTYAVNFSGGLPDIIAYLQRETELTRSTIVKILIESGRIKDFTTNPQIFMDSISAIMKKELHRLIVDGVKYEKIAGDEFSMRLFEQKEIVTYLTNLLEVRKSIYDAIEYDSEIEREFAMKMDQREDIRLFVKLPSWFKIETPIGTYNPDWAIVKHDDATLYLVRETKGTRQFELLRNLEADKIKCGRKHFEELGVDYDVVVSSSEV